VSVCLLCIHFSERHNYVVTSLRLKRWERMLLVLYATLVLNGSYFWRILFLLFNVLGTMVRKELNSFGLAVACVIKSCKNLRNKQHEHPSNAMLSWRDFSHALPFLTSWMSEILFKSKPPIFRIFSSFCLQPPRQPAPRGPTLFN